MCRNTSVARIGRLLWAARHLENPLIAPNFYASAMSATKVVTSTTAASIPSVTLQVYGIRLTLIANGICPNKPRWQINKGPIKH